MADQLLEHIEERIRDTGGINIINIRLNNSDRKHVTEVQKRLEEGYRYECQVKTFVDWKEGSYSVLMISLDGASRLILPNKGPTPTDGMIGV